MKTKITIRNICEMLLQIIMIAIGITVPTFGYGGFGYRSLFFVDSRWNNSSALGGIVFACMLFCLILYIVQVASSKKSIGGILFFSLLQTIFLVAQRIVVTYEEYLDWSSDYSCRHLYLYVESEWTIILCLCIVQLGLCWIGYFALKDNDDPEEDQPTSDSTDNTMSSVVTNDSIEKQLNDCKHLFDAGLISEKDYEEKRKQILGI